MSCVYCEPKSRIRIVSRSMDLPVGRDYTHRGGQERSGDIVPAFLTSRAIPGLSLLSRLSRRRLRGRSPSGPSGRLPLETRLDHPAQRLRGRGAGHRPPPPVRDHPGRDRAGLRAFHRPGPLAVRAELRDARRGRGRAHPSPGGRHGQEPDPGQGHGPVGGRLRDRRRPASRPGRRPRPDRRQRHGRPRHRYRARALVRSRRPDRDRFSRDGTLRCRDRASGVSLWKLRTGSAILAPPVVDPEQRRLYLGTTDRRILEVGLEKGKKGWAWKVGADVESPGLIHEHRVFFTAFDAVLYALNRGNGNLVWRAPLPSRPLSGPILSRATVLGACHEKDVIGFNVKTGTPVGNLRTTARIGTPPLLLDGRLFLGLRDRSVVGFELASFSATLTPSERPTSPPLPRE